MIFLVVLMCVMFHKWKKSIFRGTKQVTSSIILLETLCNLKPWAEGEGTTKRSKLEMKRRKKRARVEALGWMSKNATDQKVTTSNWGGKQLRECVLWKIVRVRKKKCYREEERKIKMSRWKREMKPVEEEYKGKKDRDA